MPDDKSKVSVRIPGSMIDAVRQMGYTSTTDAIIKGLELLINGATCETVQDNSQTMQDNNEVLQDNKVMKHENELLKEYNDTLKKELEKAGQDKEDLKKTFDNYMIQVQTLINQKAIEASGAKKAWWRIW